MPTSPCRTPNLLFAGLGGSSEAPDPPFSIRFPDESETANHLCISVLDQLRRRPTASASPSPTVTASPRESCVVGDFLNRLPPTAPSSASCIDFLQRCHHRLPASTVSAASASASASSQLSCQIPRASFTRLNFSSPVHRFPSSPLPLCMPRAARCRKNPFFGSFFPS